MTGIVEQLEHIQVQLDAIEKRLSAIEQATERPDKEIIKIMGRQIDTLNRTVYNSKYENTGRDRSGLK